MHARRARKGMWVRYQGETGILNDITEDGTCEIHIVNPDGTTAFVVPNVPVAKVDQASYGDIPESRRPSTELATRLGYLVANTKE